MAKLDSYRCDEPQCGKSRVKDSNRWWVLRPILGETSLLMLMHWDERQAVMDDAFHACGEEHALAMTQRWLQSGCLLPPSSRPVSCSGALQGGTADARLKAASTDPSVPTREEGQHE